MSTDGAARLWDYVTLGGQRVRYGRLLVTLTPQYPREGRSMTAKATLESIQADAAAERTELEASLAATRARIVQAKALPPSPQRGQMVDQLERLAASLQRAAQEAKKTAQFAGGLLGTNPPTSGGTPVPPIILPQPPSGDPGQW